MKSRGVRVLLLVLAVAALAAAGGAVVHLEQRITAAQAAADAFERDARQAVVSLGDWRAAQQAYVAEGQQAGVWMTRAAALGEAIGPMLSGLRAAAGTVEAQGVLESAIESFTSVMQNDARARDYVKSAQRLSASDVIFSDIAPALDRAVIAVDTARGRERVAFAIAFEQLRRWEIIAIGAAAATALLVVALLVPIPRSGERADGDGQDEPAADDGLVLPRAGGLNLSRDLEDGVVRRARPASEAAAWPPAATPPSVPVGPPAPRAPDLEAVAELCLSLARVQDARELQGLLERTGKTLDAIGVIVWMPDGPQGTLRPVLAQGYAAQALSRMGVVHPAADNAIATAYRTKSVVVVPAEGLASGALVAPLISSEGCSGAMALELRDGVEPTAQVRALATIVAAQFATMFTPGSVAPAPLPVSPAAGRG